MRPATVDRKHGYAGLHGDTRNAAYRAAFDAVADAIYVYNLESGELVDSNQRANEMFGNPVDGARRISTWPLGVGAPPYHEEEALRHLGAAASGDPQCFEWLAIDKMGRQLWVQVDLKRVESSRGPMLLTIVRDITSLKRSETAVREGEERFRRLAENAPDMLFRYEVAPHRGFSYISPAAERILGFTVEELCQDPDLVVSLMRANDQHLFQALLQGQTSAGRMTVNLRRKDGRPVWLELRGTVIRDHEGNPVAFEGIARDVTQRKQMEEQLLRAQRLETAGRIAGQVAHDFNNLLAPLAAYPDLIKRQLPADHPVASYCDGALEVINRLADISRDLLTLGRRGQINFQPTDVNLVVQQAFEQMLNIPDTLCVELQLAPDLPLVGGSSAQLLRAVVNLLSNARDAMGDAGRLTVTTERVRLDRPFGRYRLVRAGDYVRIRVEDTGCGIPAAVQDKIFEPFFTTKLAGDQRGSGLGLSIVQAVVEDHRGYLSVDSEVGKGSCFEVYLPAWQQPGLGLPEKALPRGNETILLVDDDRLHRERLRSSLQALGYQVQVADGGEDAIASLRKNPADLLILELFTLSGMDGVETYRRALEINPGQRALVMSGLPETQWAKDARLLGAGAFLQKPISAEALALAVRSELDRE